MDICENECDGHGAYVYGREIFHIEAKIEKILEKILGYSMKALDGDRRPIHSPLLASSFTQYSWYYGEA